MYVSVALSPNSNRNWNRDALAHKSKHRPAAKNERKNKTRNLKKKNTNNKNYERKITKRERKFFNRMSIRAINFSRFGLPEISHGNRKDLYNMDKYASASNEIPESSIIIVQLFRFVEWKKRAHSLSNGPTDELPKFLPNEKMIRAMNNTRNLIITIEH